jgi:hypothetical protein
VRIRPVTVALIASLAVATGASAGGSAKSVRIAVSAAPWVVVGSNLGITGTVTPHPAGLQLTLQRWVGTGWLLIGTAAPRTDGTFAFHLPTAKPGAAKYRVVTSKDTGFTGTSADVPVKILHWSYLADIEEFQYTDPIVGDLSLEPITASGVHFEHGIAMDPGCYNEYDGTGWVDFPLQRRYETFTAAMALGGYATTGSTATYDIVGGDGRKLASGSLAYGGGPQTVRVSVSGEYRLRLVITVPDPTHAAGCGSTYTEVVFGDAQLLGP